MNGIDEAKAPSDRELTPLYGRVLAPLIRPFPNFDLFFVKSLRRQAISRLQLRPGDRVLDAGCGPGGSFPDLMSAVTSSGAVVGVEISPDLAAHAQKRIARNGWTNAQVIVADARQVKLQGSFDALLMLGTPDVYASPSALANLLPYLKNKARVVAFGAKLSHHRMGRALNSVFRWSFSKTTFSSTPKLEYDPLKTLRERGVTLTSEEHFLGWMFLAWGFLERSSRGS
jgi:precorrin-6B methylase 2